MTIAKAPRRTPFWLWSIPIAALGIGLWLAWRSAPVTPSQLLHLASRAQVGWLAAAVAGQILHFVGYKMLFAGALRAVGVRNSACRWPHLMPRVLAWTAADRIMPLAGLGGGAALVGLLAADAPPNRVAPSRTVAAMTLVYALDYGVFAILAVATLVPLAAAHALTRGEAIAVITLTGIVVCVAVGLALALRRWPRASGRLLRLPHFAATMAKRRPKVLLGSVAGCLVREAGDAFALVAACRAFGVQAPALMIAAMYVISGAIALVSFVPQGIGVVEASITILLRGLGVPPGSALAACLLFRGVSFWLPIPLGMAVGAAIRRGAVS
jgi:uncharacterized membrane protein YbhN (UPF0104 family)